ncbi:TIGR02678 family protein [Agromyces protaetiae]|uniref:TIGR02678 family protein n=1 Tax=Agromyces protaetiae TaxID=2509455 RepID=A0A4P6FIC2_9MICO|nr:TIGR02678 family protein [Agromyces protaetiae]QAY73717.1 TIGR02678 family protein [Agromyces protaetiae]
MSASGIDDRQLAARLLLKRPLIRSSDVEAFRLVRRHAQHLRDWFDRETGWVLHLDSTLVRLHREPAVLDDGTHPFALRGVPFSRRRYVLLMLCLAVLERSDAQIALGRLAEQVTLQAQHPELAAIGFTFSLEGYDERRDFVEAVRMLLEWGVLDRVVGDEREFTQSTGDALYDVSRHVLAELLVTRRPPSTVAGGDTRSRIEAIRDRGLPPTEELRNLRLRQSLTRRLLDDPILMFDDLDDDEAAYLRTQRGAIIRRIGEFSGLVPEIRLEGIAMVDLDDDLTDQRMPAKGTEGHVTLLVAEHLAAVGDRTIADLHAYVRGIAPRFASYWRGGASEPGAEVGLVETALTTLHALRLVALDGAVVRVNPAIARFSVSEPIILGGPKP